MVDVAAGETLSDVAGVSGVLITGSGAMLSSPEPWMLNCADWLVKAIAAGIPTLGVCFGHQLLAFALGGEIGSNPNGLEAGTINVEFNDRCERDALFGSFPESAYFHAHHYETIARLPVGAVVLAANAVEAYQVVRFANNAWGSQFHPEFSVAIMHALLDEYAPRLTKLGYDVMTIRNSLREARQGAILLRKFVGLTTDK